MHISEGVCPPPVLIGGFLVASVLTAGTLPALAKASAPRVSVFTGAFFAASLLQLRFGPGSVHLSLLGLTGIVLGRAALPAVLVGVALQLFLFAQGGVTTLGLNVTTMGVGALVAGGVWRLGSTPSSWRAGLAAGLGTATALALYAAALLSAGEALQAVATASFVLHAPILVIEIALTVIAVRFLARVQPSLLDLPLPPPEPAKAATESPPGTGSSAPSEPPS
ncbi:MAG: energy-coupling factor ABC transporter permease [Planctomycetes bacterium]|nr:energy-coupling factor ABC transporter permease [Planctomycetota bacterium]